MKNLGFKPRQGVSFAKLDFTSYCFQGKWDTFPVLFFVSFLLRPSNQKKNQQINPLGKYLSILCVKCFHFHCFHLPVPTLPSQPLGRLWGGPAGHTKPHQLGWRHLKQSNFINYQCKCFGWCFFVGPVDSYLLWTYPTHSRFIRNQLLFYSPPGTQRPALRCAPPCCCWHPPLSLFWFLFQTICLTSLYSIYQMPCGWNTDLGNESQGQCIWGDGPFPRQYSLTQGW